MNVILIGYRGSGKTTVGRLLAQRLHRPFIDADDRIVAAAGKSIQQIFAEHGEPHFRDLEQAVISELAILNDHVLALGGGALGRAATRSTLAGERHRLIYLRCDPAELLRRVSADTATPANRPPLTNLDPLAEIRTILAGREPIYLQCMHAQVDVTGLAPEAAAAAVAKLL